MPCARRCERAWPSRNVRGPFVARQRALRLPTAPLFEQLRASLRNLLDNATAPGDRREVLTEMKAALVQARMGLEDLRGGVEQSRARAAAAREELETIRRRKGLAQQISDAETVAVAEKFEALQTERVSVLEQKLEAQE